MNRNTASSASSDTVDHRCLCASLCVCVSVCTEAALAERFKLKRREHLGTVKLWARQMEAWKDRLRCVFYVCMCADVCVCM